MALPSRSADAPFSPNYGNKIGLPVNSNTTIYAGNMLSYESTGTGCVHPLVAGEVFAGHAAFGCDNAGGANGAVQVEVYAGPYRWCTANSNIQGVTNTNAIPTPVFANTANTLTMIGSGNSPAGYIIRRGVTLNNLECEVLFTPLDPRVPSTVATFANVNTNCSNDNTNTLASTFNALITALIASGLISAD